MANIFSANTLNATLKMHECGQNEYWFYHKGSYPNAPPLLYWKIISNAASEIIIFDPYFNVIYPSTDQNIFANIQNNITIKILTLKGLDASRTYFSDVENAMKIAI